MRSKKFSLFLKALICISVFLLITACLGGELKHIQNLYVSNNQDNHSLKASAVQIYNHRKLLQAVDSEVMNDSSSSSDEQLQPPTSNEPGSDKKKWDKQLVDWLPYILGIVCIILFFVVIYFVTVNVNKEAKEQEILKSLAHSPQENNPPPALIEEVLKPEEGRSELVFFVEEEETFKLDDLFEATADLQSQTLYSSLYKVILKNNSIYAVRRLKKLQVSFSEFSKIMRQIGKLKHPNILPLVGYNSTSEEKLLIYKYQNNGSLLNLLEDHIEGKKVFPWKLRLCIAIGIARGLDFIYQNSRNPETIPHGNLKSSNILLNENEEPLISEYGFTRILDPKKASLFPSNGYTAPEKTLSEQADVFSFGIILLELLTGKAVENSGIDLPKWVRSMVREEWTGEVFDKEVNNAGREYAFPLLNIALKCVSNLPEDRPTMAEVMEKIEEVVNVHDDISISSMASIESTPQDCCLLHTVIPETWDTPGSNY
ncbi:hypothetical protein JCGZ_00991 [Jatropha curcas]|uniref:Protein kinase domain-containing protein n=1 Tax=Jatropha curcas TaxID=180498 RepID=A0A067L597_JATCU|nr:leucine-rich repeat receptor-like protein kinase PXC1 [Jatropha curcas]KDP39234.1 hypothetical protein JCGZ_00991 [Jatropha curcas]